MIAKANLFLLVSVFYMFKFILNNVLEENSLYFLDISQLVSVSSF